MSNAIDQTYRSAASIDAEEAHYAGIQEERDAEASELRLSVIEHLDRQHAELFIEWKRTCSEIDRYSETAGSIFIAIREMREREQALWDALEIVRNIEARV